MKSDREEKENVTEIVLKSWF